ncbi:DUF1080 domain-containing protein [Sphingobacterium sp. lm-10]|uniref:3-keto-disaccharide hydrolase n=1 Tax=Sphingobacterium sp. lm-10 TaxID=2944904 RepID=UPI00201FD5A6|nr:DUF1080 domain-containing protein [Sphingobacterium sp. lm-10]MCL7988717.1 DUF1080 domain-containing protein [Sphingobacterium sp. lm-10]
MRILFNILIILMISSCAQRDKKQAIAKQEHKVGEWNDLLIGDSLAGWHLYNAGNVVSKWKVDQGELTCDPHKADGIFGDLITDDDYEDFELALEWKVNKGGNSGILINVKEDSAYAATFATGLEMQLLDNQYAELRHQRDSTHWAGCLYSVDCLAENSLPLPYGQWNKARIVQQKGKVSFWLNEKLTFEREINSPAFQELVSNSPITAYPDFGKYPSGKIALQNHTDSVSFRNIRIKQLL